MVSYVFIFVIGLSIGSFINVLLYRLPKGENVLSGRSKCPHCKQNLAWLDLMPVVSFLVLGGKCRQCQKTISPIYPVIELTAAGLALLSYLALGGMAVVSLVFWMVICQFFLVLFLFDLKSMILPDAVIATLLLFSIAYWALSGILPTAASSWTAALGGGVALSLILGSLWFLSKGRWIGFGDVKLAFAIGFLFGFFGGLLVLYGAFIAGGLVSVVMLLTKKANLKTKLPLGSFISLAAIVYILFGQTILSFFKITLP